MFGICFVIAKSLPSKITISMLYLLNRQVVAVKINNFCLHKFARLCLALFYDTNTVYFRRLPIKPPDTIFTLYRINKAYQLLADAIPVFLKSYLLLGRH